MISLPPFLPSYLPSLFFLGGGVGGEVKVALKLRCLELFRLALIFFFAVVINFYLVGNLK